MPAAGSPVLAIGLSLAVGAAASCGGSVQVDTGSGGQAGSGGGVGTSGGGGVSGTAGASPELPARCLLPLEHGACSDRVPVRYFHDARTGICEGFLYLGCGGNENNFETREACQAACRGGQIDMDACTTSAECTLTGTGCCDGCGGVPGHMLVPINQRHRQEYDEMKACKSTCSPCRDDELQATRQYFVSVCTAGQCALVDVRKTAVTECTSDADCRLRDGAGCCDECDGRGLVAVRPELNRELMCEGNEGCPPCAGVVPPEYVPRCTSGRCTVTRVTP